LEKRFELLRQAKAILLFGFLATLAAGAAAADDEPKITEETPYVKSPAVVVEAMLKLAGVRANDFVIDLGSGDGRIVIDAAKKYHARGLGIDYDPRLVKLATQNARAAGVTGSVSFQEQDIFKTDFSAASVVTMYLLPEYNLALRPRLLQLKPGTRIVSHDWDMGDWQADASVTIPVPDKPVGMRKASTVFLWIVPARIEGRWRSRVPTSKGVADVEFDLRQSFQRFAGTATVRGRQAPLARTFLKADTISFRFADGGETLRFQGRVSNGRIAGQLLRPGDKSHRWRALLDSPKEALINVMPAKPVLECLNRGAGIQQAAEIPGFPLTRE
jgi:SAM-dependent methyltransferase